MTDLNSDCFDSRKDQDQNHGDEHSRFVQVRPDALNASSAPNDPIAHSLMRCASSPSPASDAEECLSWGSGTRTARRENDTGPQSET